MNRFRFATALLLTGLAALPAAALTIPTGDDPWVTPAGGQTKFKFPPGDVESLCGAVASSSWNHQVLLKGIAVPGKDYDTVVRRLKPATFDTFGVASTPIEVVHMTLASISSQSTPCGPLDWDVSLSGPQAVTTMKLLLNSGGNGGVFAADISVNVEFKAYKAGGSTYIGSLFYNLVLPDPANGTPWSFGKKREFRAGMTTSDDCIAVLREKLLDYDTESDHYYWISDMIAQGLCTKG